MKRLATALVLAAMLHAPSQATAQTNISQFQFFSPTNTVLYLPFQVLTGGSFTLETFADATVIDPYIFLFSGACWTGGCLGTFLASNDDSGPNSIWDSRIITPLGSGSYTLAMSVWTFSESEARAGSNPFTSGTTGCDNDGNWADCMYEMTIVSDQGVARLASTSVPEPASALLVGIGLSACWGIPTDAGRKIRRRTTRRSTHGS